MIRINIKSTKEIAFIDKRIENSNSLMMYCKYESSLVIPVSQKHIYLLKQGPN